MAESTSASVQPLSQQMEKLTALEPNPFPVISLYLSLSPDGRESYQAFTKKAFSERVKAMRSDSAERQSLQQDVERIQKYLDHEKDGLRQGVAIFACAGSDLFETVTLDTPFDDHWLFVGSEPHLYPLAKLMDTYPRYAAVLLDTNKARILVYSLAATARDEQVVSNKTRRTSKGGWSQARYQRRADNVHTHHMREVVDALERIVREEKIEQIVLAGDDVAVAKLREELPAPLTAKVVDTLKLPVNASGDNIHASTFDAIRIKDAETDVEKVQELFDEWHGGGLAVAGPEATLRAFDLGQVEELIITGSVESLKPVQTLPETAVTDMQADTSAVVGVDEPRLKLSAELIKRAQQTGARIRIIEDAALLEDVGGVGALLRFRI